MAVAIGDKVTCMMPGCAGSVTIGYVAPAQHDAAHGPYCSGFCGACGTPNSWGNDPTVQPHGKP